MLSTPPTRSAFGVLRRPDDTYEGVIVRCPTHPEARAYEAGPPLAQQDGEVWIACYWCDTRGRIRGRDADFDRGHPQPHVYPLVEALCPEPRSD